MNELLARELEKVDVSYRARKQAEEKVWVGFDKEVDGLKKIVAEGFGGVLKQVKLPEDAQINDVAIQYHPDSKNISMNLKVWGLSPRDIEDNIAEFKDNFNVRWINYSWECKSNHA